MKLRNIMLREKPATKHKRAHTHDSLIQDIPKRQLQREREQISGCLGLRVGRGSDCK